jgi:hypothetical protein
VENVADQPGGVALSAGRMDSEEDMNAFMQVAVKLIAEADMKLAGPPEVGELLNVVCPE